MKFLENIIKVRDELNEVKLKIEHLSKELDNNLGELVQFLKSKKLIFSYDPEKPEQFINYYECVCGNRWEDAWLATCDDECSECGRSISPYESLEVFNA